jgi:hypothetical protein
MRQRRAGDREGHCDASFANPVVRSLKRTLDIGRRPTIASDGNRLLLEYWNRTVEYTLLDPVKGCLDGLSRRHTACPYPHEPFTDPTPSLLDDDEERSLPCTEPARIANDRSPRRTWPEKSPRA